MEITKQEEPTRIMIPECVCPESCDHYNGVESTYGSVGNALPFQSPAPFDFGATLLHSRLKRMINRTTTTPTPGSSDAGQGHETGAGSESKNSDPGLGSSGQGSIDVICGSDGKDYMNECELKKTSCRAHRPIVVKYRGKCGMYYISFLSQQEFPTQYSTLLLTLMPTYLLDKSF